MDADLELFAGDTLEIVVTVKDEAGIIVDLTGSEVLWQLGKSNWKTDPIPLVTKTSINAADISLTPEAGQFAVHLLSADTEGMLAGTYYHEAQVTLSDGTVGTPMTGKFKIKQNMISPR